MKDKQILIQLEQIVAIIRDEINREADMDRNCRLQDAQEYLRRAWHAADGSATEDNDTTIETQRAMTL